MSAQETYLLHIESATAVCSVALSRKNELIAVEETAEGMRHSSVLVPYIQEVVRRSGIAMADLSGVAISEGPGSYTGLRVGMSSAKGISFGLNIPLISVSTLEALALAAVRAYPGYAHYLPMIDARRMEVYTALFDASGSRLSPDKALIVNAESVLELLKNKRKCLYFGDGAGKCRKVMPEAQYAFAELACSARHLVGLAWDAYRRKKFTNAMYATPVYLKPPNITKPSHQRL